MDPRGIRNNNPGNIKRSDDAWVGLADSQQDDVFFTFAEPRYGIRAMCKLLQTYQEVHNKRTLAEIIDRWAPPSENDTDAYVRAVSAWTGLAPNEPLDVTQYNVALPLVRAMVRMENGKPPENRPEHWYDDKVYEQGLRLAGVSPNKRLSQSRVTKGSATAVAGVTTAVGILTDTLGLPAEIASLLPVALTQASDEAVAVVVLGIALAGAAYSIYARRDDKLNGRL